MGRRTDIDWGAIERDYRAGQLSIREQAAKHKVSPSAITRKAEALGWERDLTLAVQARTKTLLATAESVQRTQESARIERPKPSPGVALTPDQQAALAIEETATTNVKVVLEHRRSAQAARDLIAGMLQELARPGRGNKKLPLKDRASIVKGLTEALRVQVAVERQAFNIADGDKPADPFGLMIAELQKGRSALPIVEQDAG